MRKLSPTHFFTYLFTASLALGLLPCPVFALEAHQEIKGLFRNGRDVTVKCLECHKKEADEVLQSSHWSWKRQRTINGKQALFGKRDSLTGFAIDVSSNPNRCMSCHVSNTPHDTNFTNPGPDMVDCLVCHDTTGTYRFRENGSSPENEADLQFLARNTGLPTPRNCTTCHFAACGLTGTDQRVSLDRSDIHLSNRGSGFTCQSCHLNNSGHTLSRKIPSINDENGPKPEGCVSCHSNSPHAIDKLNSHTAMVACQTCHIPAYAVDEPAMIGWNWLMAGRTDNVTQGWADRRFLLHDQNGIWSAMDIEPVYLWDDGSDTIYTRGQRIKPKELVYLQKPGNRTPQSRITPFKMIYATQLYDIKYRYLISPLLFPQGDVLFPDSEWDTIARNGMKAIILPYSGQHGFATTVTYRRINHGVVPAEKALDCLDCHGRSGRMKWKMLGYDEDPMSHVPAGSTAGEMLGREMPNSKLESLPPVQESIIPDSSVF